MFVVHILHMISEKRTATAVCASFVLLRTRIQLNRVCVAQAQIEELEYFSKFLDFFLDALLPKGHEHDYSLLIQLLVHIKECEDACHSGS